MPVIPYEGKWSNMNFSPFDQGQVHSEAASTCPVNPQHGDGAMAWMQPHNQNSVNVEESGMALAVLSMSKTDRLEVQTVQKF